MEAQTSLLTISVHPCPAFLCTSVLRSGLLASAVQRLPMTTNAGGPQKQGAEAAGHSGTRRYRPYQSAQATLPEVQAELDFYRIPIDLRQVGVSRFSLSQDGVAAALLTCNVGTTCNACQAKLRFGRVLIDLQHYLGA